MCAPGVRGVVVWSSLASLVGSKGLQRIETKVYGNNIDRQTSKTTHDWVRGTVSDMTIRIESRDPVLVKSPVHRPQSHITCHIRGPSSIISTVQGEEVRGSM